MGWEPLLANAATQIIKKILDNRADNAIDKYIFSENNLSYLKNKIFRKGLADEFMKLNSNELLVYYKNEKFFEVNLIDKGFVLPIIQEKTCEELSSLKLKLISETFELSNFLDAYTTPILNLLSKDKKKFDGLVTRIHSVQKSKITFQKANYFDGVATNFAMDYLPKGRVESLRQIVHGEKQKLNSFSKSLLVNHCGIVCMIETIDGQLIIQNRSSSVMNRARTNSASITGVVNWLDFQDSDSNDYLNLIVKSVKREAIEELRVEPLNIVFLGLFRELIRGGKPEFYFYAKIDKSFTEVLKSIKTMNVEGKKEFRNLKPFNFRSNQLDGTERKRSSFQKRIEKLLLEIGEKSNLTLMAGILICSNYFIQEDKT